MTIEELIEFYERDLEYWRGHAKELADDPEELFYSYGARDTCKGILDHLRRISSNEPVRSRQEP